METKPPKPTTDAIRAELDPPASRPLTPKESLAKAKDFLNQLQAGIDQQKADVLVQLISDYSSAAKADSKLRPQAKQLMNQMAKKVIEIEKLRWWDSITTLTVAEAMCQNSISASLKAPSTAEWHRPESGKWRDHPGFFLVTYTVDAQNSFGAKLRNSFECTVSCLGEEICEITAIRRLR